MAKKVRLGVFGLGTVGSGLMRLIQLRQERLLSTTGIELEVAGAVVKNPGKARPGMEQLAISAEPGKLLDDPEVDIIVELINEVEPALDICRRALSAGKPVVSANKALLAQHGPELLSLAQTQGVPLYAEASVGGGIPILKTLRESLVGNEFSELTAIINGTTNYILTKMAEEGLTYFEALRLASEQGYAESDPSLDVDGIDARNKLLILAAHISGGVYPEGEAYCEGITSLSERDFSFARRNRLTIRLLAMARKKNGGIELRVHPVLVPQSHPLASVRNQFNAILLTGDAVGEMMLYGLGAGAMPTASAVYADIIDICTRTVNVTLPDLPPPALPLRIHPMGDIESRYYLRVVVEDKPGIIGAVTTILGHHDVSVISAAAELISNADGIGEMEVITHQTSEKLVQAALAEIDQLPKVRGRTRLLRMID